VQTTLLGLAIAVILALVAALLAPVVVDWNHYRSAFENEATRLTGLRLKVTGPIDARILPTPLIKLHYVEISVPGRPPLLRADALELELGLSALIRGRLQASEAHLVAPQLALGLDRSGALDWPALPPSLSPDELSVSRLSIENGKITLTDASSGTWVMLQNFAFEGDVRSLVGPFSGEGSFVAGTEPYRYRMSGGRDDIGGGMRLRLDLDPLNHPLTTNLDGTVAFNRGVPQFAGTIALTRPVGVALSNGERVMSNPWRLASAIRATPAAASLKDFTFQYGPDERAINFAGDLELTFGDRPRFAGEIKALEVDVDRAMAAPDLTHRPPLILLRDFIESFAATAALPFPGALRVGIDGVTVGGTTVQALRGTLRFDDGGWGLDGFELRAPGLTAVSLSGRLQRTPQGVAFTGPAALDSADADTLLAWLGGRAATPSGQTGALTARGDITIAVDRLAVEGLTATLSGESVAGSAAYTWPQGDRPAAVNVDLHATKLDLDALTSFAETAIDGSGFAVPRAGALALDIGDATLAGVEARGIKTQIKFDAGAMQIERFSIGALSAGGLGDAALTIGGRIDELSSQPRGRLTVDLDAGTLDGLAEMTKRFAPQVAVVLRGAAARLAPAKVHAGITVERAPAGSTAKLDLTGQLGLLRLALNGDAGGDPAHPAAANLALTGRLDADDANALTALFGLSHAVGVDQLPGRLTLSVTGPLNGDLRVDAQTAASGFNAALRGAIHLGDPNAPSSTFQVLASAADLTPLQQAMTGQPGAAVPLSARAGLAISDGTLSFTQLAATIGKSSLRGRVDVKLADRLGIDGDIQADSVDAARLAALLLGLPGQPTVVPAFGQGPGQTTSAGPLWSTKSVGAGAFTALDGGVTFKFDHASLTPTLVADNLTGAVRFGSSEIVIDNLAGRLAGGALAGQLSFRRNADGLVSHGHIELADAVAATLLPSGGRAGDAKVTLKLDGDSIGANPAALIAALHGGGTIALRDARLAGLDPAAFAAAIAAADQAGAIDPARMSAVVRAALDGGQLAVPQGDAAVTIAGGKAGIANVTLHGQNDSTLALSAALDLANTGVDARMVLSAPPPARALINMRPELGIALNGPLGAPARSIDIAALTGWLAQRAAELQTRRLEAIEADGRLPAVGRVDRPTAPALRAPVHGSLVESGTQLSVPAPQTLSLRGVGLPPELPVAADGAATGQIKPRPVAPPAASRGAVPSLLAPLESLFHPKN
jgi:uncharacterized protein involved in outer membrane biogenesis